MDNQTLERFRRTLLGRRSTLLQGWRQAQADENELLAEREPDWEDAAAAVTAASVLEGVTEAKRNALLVKMTDEADGFALGKPEEDTLHAAGPHRAGG